MNDSATQSAPDSGRTLAEVLRDLLATELELRETREKLRASEEAAEQSQKRSRDLIDGLGPSMFVGLMTPQGILIEANRPALAAAGLQPDDVLGQPFEETYWWAYSLSVQQQLRKAIDRAAGGEASRYDVQVRGAQHQLVDIDFSLQPLRNDAGEVVFLAPSASVITERKATENALRESNEKFQLLVDNITDAFWIRSADMREVHYISPAFERIWGRSAESLRANPHQWSDFTVPEDRERALAAFAALRADAPSLDIEYRIVRPDGDIRWIRARDRHRHLRAHAGGRHSARKRGTLLGRVPACTDRRRPSVARRTVAQGQPRPVRAGRIFRIRIARPHLPGHHRS